LLAIKGAAAFYPHGQQWCKRGFHHASARNFDKVDVSNLSDATGSLKADLLVARLILVPVAPLLWLLQAAKSLLNETAKEARHRYEFCRASRHGNRCPTSGIW